MPATVQVVVPLSLTEMLHPKHVCKVSLNSIQALIAKISSLICPPPISTQLLLLTRVFFILRAVVIGIATNHYIPVVVLQLVVTKALLFKCPTTNDQKHYA